VVRFISRLRSAWRFTRHSGWEECDPWTKEDARFLLQFLATPQGRRLRSVLRDVCISQNATAVQQKDCLQWAAGFAMGHSALVALLETLAQADSISDSDERPGGVLNPSE